jgi:hypothetical protein
MMLANTLYSAAFGILIAAVCLWIIYLIDQWWKR